MLVVDYLLISNGLSDGAILAATFQPKDKDSAARLVLHTAGGDIAVDDEAAEFLFDYYATKQDSVIVNRLSYATISREAVEVLYEYLCRTTGRPDMKARAQEIVKTLNARIG